LVIILVLKGAVWKRVPWPDGI